MSFPPIEFGTFAYVRGDASRSWEALNPTRDYGKVAAESAWVATAAWNSAEAAVATDSD
jgi:hypothetical protein